MFTRWPSVLLKNILIQKKSYKLNDRKNNFWDWTVVGVQLAEQLLPEAENLGSNPAIFYFIMNIQLLLTIEKTRVNNNFLVPPHKIRFLLLLLLESHLKLIIHFALPKDV